MKNCNNKTKEASNKSTAMRFLSLIWEDIKPVVLFIFAGVLLVGISCIIPVILHQIFGLAESEFLETSFFSLLMLLLVADIISKIKEDCCSLEQAWEFMKPFVLCLFSTVLLVGISCIIPVILCKRFDLAENELFSICVISFVMHLLVADIIFRIIQTNKYAKENNCSLEQAWKETNSYDNGEY